MTGGISASASPRQAALLLHAMSEPDQRWLLASLPAMTRAPLQQLLAELRDLGIPPEPARLNPLLGPVLEVRRSEDGAARLLRLSDFELQVLATLLAAEPPELIVRFLRMRDWSWRAALLAKFDPVVAARLGNVGSLPRAPALEEALCAQLLQALTAAPAPPAPSSRLWNAPWFRLARRWGRA